MTEHATEQLIADGISTRVSIVGRGEPLLMFSPGGFDATLEKWSELGVYKKINIMSYLSDRFTCILFDRRECGGSGGRLEILDFAGMARHGRAVLEQLDYGAAHIIGGCLGCAPAAEFSRLYPGMTRSLNLVWPVGGARYRIRNFGRFATHLGWITEHGKDALIEKALASDVGFAKDSTLGPWGGSLRVDAGLIESLKACDEADYARLVQASYRAMFDRESAPGPIAEQLMQIRAPVGIVPGDDESHARSAAHFVKECISHATFLDLPTSEQTSESVFAFFDDLYRSQPVRSSVERQK
ncbi:alpha/beta hydrolase [Litoricolaceae bacterium]|jgi:pimeloyl-ACP methyl ester carboxylesterase|nr:alpha/beta hydrolase [Litorivicinaceae bacterium]